MANCILTGKIYFTSVPSYEELVDILYFLLEKAIVNRLGFNVCWNLTNNGLFRYPLRDYLKEEGYIPYEILDDPLSNECHEMFHGIGYSSEKPYKVGFVEKTRLPAVQNFFEDVITREKIAYMTLEIEPIHCWPIEYTEYEIKAMQFCQTVADAPNERRAEMPPIKFKIVK